MKQIKRMWIVFLAALSAVMMSLAIAACDEIASTTPESGVYYYDADDGEYLITLHSGNQYVMYVKNESTAGKYTLEGESLKLEPNGGDPIEATFRNDRITLDYHSSVMEFLKKISYTVTFETNGGSAVLGQSVINGKSAQKVGDPTYAGHRFMGWYSDAQCTTVYDFSARVMSDITIYASWAEVPEGQIEHTVFFDPNYAGAPIGAVETIGGKLLSVPADPVLEGATFVGWYTSMYEDGERLTGKFDLEAIVSEDVTVYAAWSTASENDIGMSVSEKQITWNAASGVNTYTVVVKDDSGTEFARSSAAATTFSFDFSALAAGHYTVTLENGGKTLSTRYYLNKGLEKVKNFKVLDRSVLIFDPVPMAERYYISIECGNLYHRHEAFDNNNSTYYNFANCAMKEGGIRFVVTAVADGYVSSVSEEFIYNRTLDGVSELTFDDNTGVLSWTGADNVTDYLVKITGDAEAELHTGARTAVSLKEFGAGSYTASVIGTTWGYNDSEETKIDFTKSAIASPSNIKIKDTIVSWDEVTEATSYVVLLDGIEIESPTAECDIADYIKAWAKGDDYTIQVMAKGATDSVPTDPIDVTYLTMYASLGYSDGRVSWHPVVGAEAYHVRLNNAEPVEVTDGSCSYEITFDKGGVNKISVAYVDVNGDASDYISIEVYVYTVEFDVRGGSAEGDNTLYLGRGDEIVYPAAESMTRDGYDFMGWYTAPGGAKSNARHYEEKYYNEVGDIVLFAYWDAKGVNVTYDVGDSGENHVGSEGARVYFASDFTLAVPTTTNGLVAFVGWYTGENGQGTRLTNENGESLSPWAGLDSEATVYAYWAQLFSYLELTDGTYSVLKGPGINYVTEATVPAAYNGKPVSTVESFAFNSCLKLTTVKIPDCVTNIEATAFDGCLNLKAVEIYKTDALAGEVVYSSEDGVVFKTDDSGVSLAYFPLGRRGSYTVPNGITSLPVRIFASASLTEIVLPASLKSIGVRAFMNCTRLRSVLFDNGTQALEIGAFAFQNCANLETIALPDNADFELNIFDGCSALTEITAENEIYRSYRGMLVTKENSTLVYVPKGITGEVEIPVGVVAVGSYAFQNCTNITSVVIPGFVKKIENHAFYNSGVHSVTIEGGSAEEPSEFTLGDYAFASSRSLHTVVIRNVNFLQTDEETETAVQTFGSYVFENCVTLETVTFENVTLETLPSFTFHNCYDLLRVDLPNVAQIGESAFANCTMLESIALPASVTFLGDSAFSGCERLAEVLFSQPEEETESVFVIGQSAFENCTSLEEISLPENLTTVSQYAFAGSALTSIVLPDAVTEIQGHAFENCTSLTSVTFSEHLAVIGYQVFLGCSSLTTVNLGKANFDFSSSNFTGAAISDVIVDTVNGHYKAEGGIVMDESGEQILMYIGAAETIVIPASVTEIKNEAFRDTLVKHVSFAPESKIETISWYAFAFAANLETIELPDSVKTIDSNAFYGCSALTTVTASELTAINSTAFRDCTALASIDISKVTAIGADAFYNCQSLDGIRLNSAIAAIPQQAFYNCASLTTLNLTNVTSVGYEAFYGCTLLNNIDLSALETAVYSTQNYANRSFGYCTSLETVNLSSLQTIGDYMFEGCSKLRSVDLCDETTVIPTGAFEYCSSLSEIDMHNITEVESFGLRGCAMLDEEDIPFANLDRINQGAFEGTGVRHVVLSEECYSLQSNAFKDCVDLISIVLSEEIDDIYNSAFQGCISLERIRIPSLVEYIDPYAFADCVSLIEVDLSEDTALYEVGNNAFENCISLTELDFSACTDDGWFTFYESAFVGCESLRTITFPYTMDYMEYDYDEGLFWDCVSLEEILIGGDDAYTSEDEEGNTIYYGDYFASVDGVLFYIDNSMLLYYPANKSDFSYEIPSSLIDGEYDIDEIGSYAFTQTQHLREVTLSENLSAIYWATFVDCESLTTLKFAEGCNANIRSEAFIGCTNLTSISFGDGADPNIGDLFEGSGLTEFVVPSSLTEMPSFEDCVNLQKVTFEPDSMLETIGYGSFNGCTSLNEIDLSGLTHLTEIGYNAFQDCVSLTEIVLPDCVTTLSATAFNGCTSLQSITIGSGLQSFDRTMVEGCTALERLVISPQNQHIAMKDNVVYSLDGHTLLMYLPMEGRTSFRVPDAVDVIASSAFKDAKSLTEVILPAQLTEIGFSAFQNAGIASINIPENVHTIRGNAFSDCENLSAVTFERGTTVLTIGGSAFENCTSLVSITLPARLRSSYTQNASGMPYFTDGLGSSAFRGCTALEIVNFDTSVFVSTTTYNEYLSFGNSAFENCTSLRSITLPEYVRSFATSYNYNPYGPAIGNSCFSGCTSLTEVDIQTTGDFQVGDRAFAGCSALMSLRLPEMLHSVGSNAFDGWTDEQYIYMAAHEGMSQTWSENWRTNCNAHIIWG